MSFGCTAGDMEAYECGMGIKPFNYDERMDEIEATERREAEVKKDNPDESEEAFG